MNFLRVLSVFIVGVFLFTFASCTIKPRPPKVEHISVEVELTSFYEDLFSSTNNIEEHLSDLELKYGDFFIQYCTRVIATGHPREDSFVSNMEKFLSYPPNQEVLDSVRLVYEENQWLKDELEQGFKYYKYYFPEAEVPHVYMHISGFNQSVVVDSTWLSISVEKYLGADCIFYEWLTIPVYMRRSMLPERVVPDVFKALAMSEYAYNDSVDHLLNQMVYEGKVLYFVEKMQPFLPDTILFNYSFDQLKWSKKHEAAVWASIVERKHLFSTDKLVIQRYIGDSPFTYFFGQDSPGKVAHYIGYRIVQNYMRKNPNVNLEELMKMDNGQEIFTQSGYRP